MNTKEAQKEFYKKRRQKRFDTLAENIKDFFKEALGQEIVVKDTQQKHQN